MASPLIELFFSLSFCVAVTSNSVANLVLSSNLADPNITSGCEALSPQISAYANYNAIIGCLSSSVHSVVLQRGVFNIVRGIALFPHSRIRGAGVDQTILRISSPVSIRDFVLRTSDNCSVSELTLDGADRLAPGTMTSAIRVYGNGSRITDVRAMNVRNGIGIFFQDTKSSDNYCLRVHISGCFYGVIFEHGLDKDHANTFDSGVIEDIKCDAVTFAGYGELTNSLVQNAGAGCVANGPMIPGACLRCHRNSAGAVIFGNVAQDCCGMVLDVDMCANFKISFNNFSRAGYVPDDRNAHCVGAATATLLDSQGFHVEGNFVQNDVLTNMQLYASSEDENHIFYDVGTTKFSDLPSRRNTILNFVVAHRPFSGSLPSIGHVVIGNTFQATCPNLTDTSQASLNQTVKGESQGRRLSSLQPEPEPEPETIAVGSPEPDPEPETIAVGSSPEPEPELQNQNNQTIAFIVDDNLLNNQTDAYNYSNFDNMTNETAVQEAFDLQSSETPASLDCFGLGYFVGRGTGQIRDDWTPRPLNNESVPSIFMGNDPLDSDFGSIRCGFNSYGGNSSNCPPGADSPCNRDDYDHNKTPSRNDVNCSDFAYHIVLGDSAEETSPARIRIALPLHKSVCSVVGAGPNWAC